MDNSSAVADLPPDGLMNREGISIVGLGGLF